MKVFKYLLIILSAVVLLGLLLMQNHTVQNKLFERTAKQLLTAEEIFMEDALSVAVCGSRSPLPGPNRAETCLLIQAGPSKFIIDLGRGSGDNLQKWQVDYSDLEAVILSHLHSDHISDLAEIQFQTCNKKIDFLTKSKNLRFHLIELPLRNGELKRTLKSETI